MMAHCSEAGKMTGQSFLFLECLETCQLKLLLTDTLKAEKQRFAHLVSQAMASHVLLHIGIKSKQFAFLQVWQHDIAQLIHSGTLI